MGNDPEATMRDPQALIGTERLAAALGDTSLRVFDCTTILRSGTARQRRPLSRRPGPPGIR